MWPLNITMPKSDRDRDWTVAYRLHVLCGDPDILTPRFSTSNWGDGIWFQWTPLICEPHSIASTSAYLFKTLKQEVWGIVKVRQWWEPWRTLVFAVTWEGDDADFTTSHNQNNQLEMWMNAKAVMIVKETHRCPKKVTKNSFTSLNRTNLSSRLQCLSVHSQSVSNYLVCPSKTCKCHLQKCLF